MTIDMTFETREKLFRAEEREEGRCEGRQEVIDMLLKAGTITPEAAEEAQKQLAGFDFGK